MILDAAGEVIHAKRKVAEALPHQTFNCDLQDGLPTDLEHWLRRRLRERTKPESQASDHQNHALIGFGILEQILQNHYVGQPRGRRQL